MEKHILNTILLIFLIVNLTIAQTTITLIDGSTGNLASCSPTSQYRSRKLQYIYLKSEIETEGISGISLLESIQFEIDDTESGRETSYENYVVKIKNYHVDSVEFTHNVFKDMSDATTCFSGTWTGIGTTSGYKTIDFYTEFLWDGESNLLIEISFYDEDMDTGTNGDVVGSDAILNRTLRVYSDNSDCRGETTGYIKDEIPNIKLTFSGDNFWTGQGADNSWFTPGNWSYGTIPVSGDNVIIPPKDTVKFIQDGFAVTGCQCNDFKINENALLTTWTNQSGASYLEIQGNIVLNGTLSAFYNCTACSEETYSRYYPIRLTGTSKTITQGSNADLSEASIGIQSGSRSLSSDLRVMSLFIDGGSFDMAGYDMACWRIYMDGGSLYQDSGWLGISGANDYTNIDNTNFYEETGTTYFGTGIYPWSSGQFEHYSDGTVNYLTNQTVPSCTYNNLELAARTGYTITIGDNSTEITVNGSLSAFAPTFAGGGISTEENINLNGDLYIGATPDYSDYGVGFTFNLNDRIYRSSATGEGSLYMSDNDDIEIIITYSNGTTRAVAIGSSGGDKELTFNGTVIYNSPGSQVILPLNYKDISFQGTGTKTLLNGLDIEGDLNLIEGTVNAEPIDGTVTPSYCTPSTTQNASHVFITEVYSSGSGCHFINTSSSSVNNGYTDYTDEDFYILFIRDEPSYQLSIKMENHDWTISAYDKGYVWVDWNQDGDFSDPDESFQCFYSASDYQLYSIISIPDDAKLGATCLRVGVEENGTPTACETGITGEFEDYKVFVNTAYINLAGDWVNHASNTIDFAYAHSTVTFDGSNVQNINQNGRNIDFYTVFASGSNVNFYNSGANSAGENVTVNNDLFITNDSILNLYSPSVLSSNENIELKGILNNKGTVTGTNYINDSGELMYFSMSGTDKTLTGDGDYNNFLLQCDGTVEIAENNISIHSIKITESNELTVAVDKTLTLSNDVTIYGTLKSKGGTTINVAGNWYNSGTHDIVWTNNVVFNGTDNCSITGPASSETLFFEDFEDAGNYSYTTSTNSLNNLPEWEYVKSATGRLQTAHTGYNSSSHSATLDSETNGSDSYNEMILTIDMSDISDSTDIKLSFYWYDHGDETNGTDDDSDRISVRGSNSDSFKLLYKLDPGSAADDTWLSVSDLNITDTLEAHNQSLSSTFQIKFRQYDNYPVESDGISFDNITVVAEGGNILQEVFEDIEINKTSNSEITLNSNVTYEGDFTFTEGIVNTSENKYFVIRDGVSDSDVSNGSSNAFINGPVKKIGNDSPFTFPLGAKTGNGNIWAPIEISSLLNNSNSDEWIAEYLWENPDWDENDSIAETIHHISRKEYWQLTKAEGAEDLTCKVKLYWDNNETHFIDNNFIDELTVAHFYNVGGTEMWVDEGNADCSDGTTQNGWIKSNQLSDNGKVTLGSTSSNNPLPVSLVSFDYQCNNSFLSLSWITLTEINNDYFILLSSKNGITWDVIDTIQGQGNTSELSTYEYRIYNNYDNKYYKLIQVDYSGVKNKLPIIFSDCSQKNDDCYEIYPNPASEYVVIKINSADNEQFNCKLFNCNSKAVISKTLLSNQNNFINVKNLSPGVYLIQLSSLSRKIIEKIIIF